MNAIAGLTEITARLQAMREDLAADLDRLDERDRLRAQLAAAEAAAAAHGQLLPVPQFVGTVPTMAYLQWLARSRELADEVRRARTDLWIHEHGRTHEPERCGEESMFDHEPRREMSDLQREIDADNRERGAAVRELAP